jgi:redox-sensitive bicupin YhaK (pirin superfamily)
MIEVRPAAERGRASHGWLESRHTFSFADYWDPAHMGFRALRVINEDRVQPGRGFGSHPHRDMEIISYVLEGGLEHRDSMGHGSVIVPGDVQRMTAGTGVAHSEFNASRNDVVHFLQIWIVPDRRGLAPSYEQRRFTDDEKKNRFCLVASRDGRDGSVTVHQDAELWVGLLDPGVRVAHALASGRHAWLQVTRGKVLVNGLPLAAGDGAAVTRESSVEVEASERAEVLLFDLA